MQAMVVKVGWGKKIAKAYSMNAQKRAVASTLRSSMEKDLELKLPVDNLLNFFKGRGFLPKAKPPNESKVG